MHSTGCVMNDRLREVAQLSRKIIHSIWKKTERALPLTAEEERIADVLRRHREYERVWQGTEKVRARTGMVNPYLHVHIHLIVEKQLRDGEPPEVKGIADCLAERGMEQHRVVHSIGVVFLEEMYNMIREHRPFDHRRYVEKLQKLARNNGAKHFS
jgi:hypothetical protein